MIYILVLIILFILEMGYFYVANHFHIIDKPNERSSHTTVTLRGGGIIFLFGAWLFYFFFGFQYPWFILGLSLIGLISFIDDIHSLPDSTRLVVQFIAMAFMFYQFGILEWQDWWIVLIALIVSVGIINAYNFMDGINGITGGYSLVVLAPLIFLNFSYDFISMPFLYVIGISVLIFCFFNFRLRAICFAGDVGAISMGFIVVFALGKLILQTGNFAYITFLAVYGADSILTICHRILLHENIGKAHRKHAFQILANELHFPQPVVSLMYMALQLAISFGLIFLPINNYIYMGFIIVILAAAYLLFMKKYYHLHKEFLQHQIETSQKS